MLRRRLGQNAVAEIEDKRALSQGHYNAIDAIIERLAAHHQRRRIEIALHSDASLKLLRDPQRHRRIETEPVGATALGKSSVAKSGATRKENDRNPRVTSLDFGDDPAQRTETPALGFGFRQDPHPA